MPDTPPAADVYDRIRAKADEIEAELRRIGYWQAQQPKPEAFKFKRAFAADTMSFGQWLQFVFLPRARDVAAKRDQTPDASNVGAYAVRELDGDAKADQLITLLSEFDALFGTPRFDLGGLAGRRRVSRTTLALAWTVVATGLGILFAGYAARLLPVERHEHYKYSAHEPASGGYEEIALSADADGKVGATRARELRLQVRSGDVPVPGGELLVDLTTSAYRYAEADGAERSGPLSADGLVKWMKRCGVTGDDAKLAAEADALARFADAIRRDPAGTFAARRQAGGPAAGGEPFRLSAISTFVLDHPATLPWAARVGVPAGVWVIGLVGIGLFGPRRE